MVQLAAAIVAAQEIVPAAVIAAVAEQQDQNDNPANVATAETVIVTHKEYLREYIRGVCRSFHGILSGKKGAGFSRSAARFY